MKPRILKIKGLWHCSTGLTLIGLGFTPKTAYEDWLKHYNAEAKRLKKEQT
jgi:hypothetical protein